VVRATTRGVSALLQAFVAHTPARSRPARRS
jgi:hypothetical protein